MVYKYADPIADADYYLSQLGAEIQRNSKIKEYMEKDKQEALMKLSNYLEYDLTPKKLELLGRILAYTWFDNIPEADNLIREMKVNDKHLSALEGNQELYEKIMISENESNLYEDDDYDWAG